MQLKALNPAPGIILAVAESQALCRGPALCLFQVIVLTALLLIIRTGQSSNATMNNRAAVINSQCYIRIATSTCEYLRQIDRVGCPRLINAQAVNWRRTEKKLHVDGRALSPHARPSIRLFVPL